MQMPVKGYKKPNSRNYMARIRLSEEERELFEEARVRARFNSLSEWLRHLARTEAIRFGLTEKKPD